MQAWAIVVDHLRGSWKDEYLFEDRLLFVGLNLDTVKDQLKQVISNPHKLLTSQWGLDYDGCKFLLDDGDCPDECVLYVGLVHNSRHDSNLYTYTYLYFRLLLLDLHEHSTLQTSVPAVVIQDVYDCCVRCFPTD